MKTKYEVRALAKYAFKVEGLNYVMDYKPQELVKVTKHILLERAQEQAAKFAAYGIREYWGACAGHYEVTPDQIVVEIVTL